MKAYALFRVMSWQTAYRKMLMNVSWVCCCFFQLPPSHMQYFFLFCLKNEFQMRLFEYIYGSAPFWNLQSSWVFVEMKFNYSCVLHCCCCCCFWQTPNWHHMNSHYCSTPQCWLLHMHIYLFAPKSNIQYFIAVCFNGQILLLFIYVCPKRYATVLYILYNAHIQLFIVFCNGMSK